MKDKAKRRSEIEAAAFEVLAEKGYRRTSMLQIAKRASASNQTLYAWYGNKQGLFQSLIEVNAKAINTLLEESLQHASNPLNTLKKLGILLLTFTTGDKAIIMNRAAIADVCDTAVLAETIDKVARQNMVSKIEQLMRIIVEQGIFKPETNTDEATEIYLSILFGEVQIRQAMGRIEPLDTKTIEYRANRAFLLTCQLYRQEIKK